MIRTEDITSVTEHRGRLRDHLRQVNDTGRPLFITSNGTAEAVVLSPAAYDELVEHAERARGLRMIEDGMADIAAGRTEPASESFADIRRELQARFDSRRDPASNGA